MQVTVQAKQHAGQQVHKDAMRWFCQGCDNFDLVLRPVHNSKVRDSVDIDDFFGLGVPSPKLYVHVWAAIFKARTANTTIFNGKIEEYMGGSSKQSLTPASSEHILRCQGQTLKQQMHCKVLNARNISLVGDGKNGKRH